MHSQFWLIHPLLCFLLHPPTSPLLSPLIVFISHFLSFIIYSTIPSISYVNLGYKMVEASLSLLLGYPSTLPTPIPAKPFFPSFSPHCFHVTYTMVSSPFYKPTQGSILLSNFYLLFKINIQNESLKVGSSYEREHTKFDFLCLRYLNQYIFFSSAYLQTS